MVSYDSWDDFDDDEEKLHQPLAPSTVSIPNASEQLRNCTADEFEDFAREAYRAVHPDCDEQKLKNIKITSSDDGKRLSAELPDGSTVHRDVNEDDSIGYSVVADSPEDGYNLLAEMAKQDHMRTGESLDNCAFSLGKSSHDPKHQDLAIAALEKAGFTNIKIVDKESGKILREGAKTGSEHGAGADSAQQSELGDPGPSPCKTKPRPGGR